MLNSKPTNWSLEEWLTAVKRIKTLSCRKNSHWDAYYYNSKYDRYINIPVILISSFISATAVSQTSSTEEEVDVTPYYVLTGLGAASTILTSINKYFAFAEAKEAHKQTAFNYLRLRCELVEMVESRDISGNCAIEYEEFNTCYFKNMTNIRENAPVLPKFIQKTMDEAADKKIQKFIDELEKEKSSDNVVVHVETNASNSIV